MFTLIPSDQCPSPFPPVALTRSSVCAWGIIKACGGSNVGTQAAVDECMSPMKAGCIQLESPLTPNVQECPSSFPPVVLSLREACDLRNVAACRICHCVSGVSTGAVDLFRFDGEASQLKPRLRKKALFFLRFREDRCRLMISIDETGAPRRTL